ncbi:MAG: LysR family transcriptional regulator [Solirubrobacteraceae bacterium]
MLDTRRLRVLCEVARNGSFSAAAAALGYTQPAVSRQVATLEAEVGATLVRRVPQGAVLTDAGRLLVERGEAILVSLDGAEAELRGLAGLEGGRLRLASFASAAASIVPIAIARFRERYGAVELHIIMSDPDESLARMRAGELELALSHDRLGPSADDPSAGRAGLSVADPSAGGAGLSVADPSAGEVRPSHGVGSGADCGPAGVELVHLFDDPMYVAMAAGHRLARVEKLGLTSFSAEPWMLATMNSCPDSRLFLRACHSAGFEPRIAFQNDDYSAILGFVAAGVGVALIPEMVTRGIRGDVVVRALEPAPPPRPILAMLPMGYRSPAAAAMLAVLQEVSEGWVAERRALTIA